MARYLFTTWRSPWGWMVDIRESHDGDVTQLGTFKTEREAKHAAREKISTIGSGRHVVQEEGAGG